MIQLSISHPTAFTGTWLASARRFRRLKSPGVLMKPTRVCGWVRFGSAGSVASRLLAGDPVLGPEISANHGIVIVGASSLQTEAVFEYFVHRLEQVILVTAAQEVLIKRRPRTLKGLLQNEFTDRHKKLHASVSPSRVIQNDSDDSREAEARLLDQIAAVLGLSGSR